MTIEISGKKYELVLDEEHIAYDIDTLVPYDVYKTIKSDFIFGVMIGRFRVIFDENQEELAKFHPISSSITPNGERSYRLVSIDELSKYNTIYKKYQKKHNLK
jgi:hypothetical protein